SNEGRGWLPTDLYLPREVTTPWMWSVAEGAAWEGVADPARILAEFALAWGAKSGGQTRRGGLLPTDRSGSAPTVGRYTDGRFGAGLR
ncbi:hypothetical protein, partial [Nocardia paucivorans]|uniref:hypothetical protein n=1 Tax=Nocardia paucivorans TaxID=114259 RepID=UPI001C3F1E3A